MNILMSLCNHGLQLSISARHSVQCVQKSLICSLCWSLIPLTVAKHSCVVIIVNQNTRK